MLVHEALTSVHTAERLQRQAQHAKQQRDKAVMVLQRSADTAMEVSGGEVVAPSLTMPVLANTSALQRPVGTPASESNNGNSGAGDNEGTLQ